MNNIPQIVMLFFYEQLLHLVTFHSNVGTKHGRIVAKQYL